MATILHKLRLITGNRKFVILFGVVCVVSQEMIAYLLHDLDLKQVLKLQTSLSADAFRTIINSWINEGKLELYKNHFYLDFPHPIWYSMFLVSSISLTFNLNHTAQKFNYLLLLPSTAGLLDLLENILHLVIMSDMENISGTVVTISGVASNLKWLLAFISIGIITVSSIKYILRKNSLLNPR